VKENFKVWLALVVLVVACLALLALIWHKGMPLP
jgi:hypothetical protein